MPSWFAKVFKGGAADPAAVETATAPEPIKTPNPILEDDDPETDEYEGPALRTDRRIVQPTVIMDDDDGGEAPEGIGIKAKISKDRRSCTLLVDRPVLAGHSAWFPTADETGDSPLAQALFAVKGVGQLLIHGMTVTITSSTDMDKPWDELAPNLGSVLRDHLAAGKPVVSEDFLEAIPGEDVIRDRLETAISMEINPAIAGHSGSISLERVDGNTVYIKMMGGCQGCAASDVTLRQGIYSTFRQTVPQVGAILDETDHNAGTNPFFSSLPPEMQDA
jgi:Fe-S cluster biogenesis protein NfuA